ncbi:hypothetical protein Bca4012_044865 [Brassica carinata]
MKKKTSAPYILVKNQAELWFVRGFQIIIARTGLDVRSLLLPKVRPNCQLPVLHFLFSGSSYEENDVRESALYDEKDEKNLA